MPSSPNHLMPSPFTFFLPKKMDDAVINARKEWTAHKMTQRLWEKDSSLWTSHHEERWMGWLDEAHFTKDVLDQYAAFQNEVFARHFTDIVVMGMGGSSLGPYVLDCLTTKLPGFGTLHMLDSTDPQIIEALTKKLHLPTTLFIVSSKSGGTLETRSFLDYFYHLAKNHLHDEAADHFIAITDPGTSLEVFGRSEKFWKIFLGHPQTGGRFSIFSPFGLVPACAAGLSLIPFKEQLDKAYGACKPSVSDENNPSIALGLFLGVLATQFQAIKITLAAPPSLKPLMQWIEQITAESTGKNGKGLIPLIEDKLNPHHSYPHGRLFIVYVEHRDQWQKAQQACQELQKQGFAALLIKVYELEQAIRQCFFWELAIAIASHYLAINPFDQPDVQSTKAKIQELIDRKLNNDDKHPPEHALRIGQLTIQAPSLEQNTSPSLEESALFVRNFLQLNNPCGYVAFLGFIPTRKDTLRELKKIADIPFRNHNVATLVCFGPRYLHSTGQLFKGGPDGGRFVLITYEPPSSLPIPHTELTFASLENMQGQGDLLALRQKGRAALYVHISGDLKTGLAQLEALILQACTTS